MDRSKFSDPSLMVKCPSCSAMAGYACQITKFGHVIKIDFVHFGRKHAYKVWKTKVTRQANQ